MYRMRVGTKGRWVKRRTSVSHNNQNEHEMNMCECFLLRMFPCSCVCGVSNSMSIGNLLRPQSPRLRYTSSFRRTLKTERVLMIVE